MKAVEFFDCCRELVQTNWTWRVHHPSGQIGLVPIVDSFDGDHSDDFHPIAAVAVALTGFNSTDPREIWRAGRLVGLSDSNTTIIFTAALMMHGLDRQTLEVREELMDHLQLDRSVRVKLARSRDEVTGLMTEDLLARHDVLCEPPLMKWTRVVKSM